jgi:uncharacterized protein (TIGR02099 family)
VKFLFKTLRILSRHTLWWIAALIVLLAIALTAARLLLPQLENYRQQLVMEASAAVGQPVSIGGLKVGWRGLGPRLVLRDVKLFDRGGEQELLGFTNAYIDISVPDSLYQHQIEFGDLTIAGVVLNVVRRADGRYELEGLNLEREVESDTSGALKWLLRQPRLVLKDSLVRWRDERSGARLEFKQVNLRLFNDGDQHQLGGEVVLPETMGGALTLRIDARGDMDRTEEMPGDMQVNFYFKGSGLRLAQWLVDRPALGMYVVNGAADLELWGLWQQQKLRQVRGEVGLHEFYLARDVDDETVAETDADAVTVKLLPSLSGRFVWQGDSSAWQLELERLQIGNGWTPSRVHIALRLHEGARTLEIATGFARLQTLAEFGLNSNLLPQAQRGLLETLQPRGDLHDAYLKLKLQPEQPPEYFARARIENFGVSPWQKLPGVDGLDLQLNLDHNGGVADLTTTAGTLDSHGLFREPLALDKVQGQLAWQRAEAGWSLDLRQITVANADLEAQLQGRVDLSEGDSPVVNLQTQIKRGDGAATPRYLPVGIMHEGTVAWLDRGIVSGQVTSGAMVLQGPLSHFPFVDGSGRFEVGFNVSDGIIDYAEEWPRIEEVEAEVKFIGNSMTIHGHSGKVLAAEIKEVQLGIADFSASPARLKLTGEAQGSTRDVLQFLNESPLQRQFGQFTTGSEASGKSQLGLKLNIPLAGDQPIATDGWVTFDNSTLNLKRLGVDLAAINGKMAFSDHGLSAEQISAEVMGQPAQLTIRTATQPPSKNKNKGSIIFEAKGESRLEALAQRIDLPIFPYLKGDSAWQARLEIPHNNAEPTLRVMSQLEGTAVMLPDGVGKTAKVARPLELLAEFGAKETLWRFDYGKTALSGFFEEIHDDQGSHLNRAELRLGHTAQLPSAPGFRVAGVMDHFDYEAWRPILFAGEAAGESKRSQSGAKQDEKATAVTDVDLSFNSALIFGQPLHQVKLQGRRLPAAWSAQVESKELGGAITLPDDFKSPLEMDLSHLYITVAEEGADKKPQANVDKEPVNPRELPPLRIKSADTHYGKAALGRMDLVTTRRANGMNIESLLLESEIATIKLQGGWTQGGDGKDLSQLNGTLDIRDLGSLLAGFGYVETVKNGKGSSSLILNWEGPLIDPSVAHLAGVVKFDINDGRLLEVNPGAGRLFGLLSVQALPRRLTLDFSDLFGKGLAFDYMRGQFDFKEGHAVTNDFVLDGPAAQVELQGRVGLVARDYDQQLKLVPHSSSSLPLAGAVVGGVGVGAAVLLVEQLLKSKLERATEIHYRVTGSWDAPVMERVER